jgi:hypothetical protein
MMQQGGQRVRHKHSNREDKPRDKTTQHKRQEKKRHDMTRKEDKAMQDKTGKIR